MFRRDSSLSNKSDYERAERRSSLRNLFSKAAKNDAASTPTPNFQEEEHLKLFKSKEFQAYLKEHNIFTTAGVQVIFQQFLHNRNTDVKSTNERVEAAQVHRRKNSGDSLLDIASRCAMPSSKRRSTNGSDNTFHESENSLDTSMWSLDDSCRKSYMTVIRGDTESIFQQPQEVKEIELQMNVNEVEHEDSMLRSLLRRSSDAMSSIDASSYRSRRDSLFSSIGGRGRSSSIYCDPESSAFNAAHGMQSPQNGEVSYKVEEGGRSTDESTSACLEDLLKSLCDDDDNTLVVEDDKSNNGEAEFFFPSRRRSMSYDYDPPPRRSSLFSKASETSSQLHQCLNEINADNNIRSNPLRNLLGDDEESISSKDDDSLGTITSFASDQALLCKSNNLQESEVDLPLRLNCIELLHADPQNLSLPRTHNSRSNLSDCSGQVQLQKDFMASGGSLLVEWGDAKSKHASEDDSV